MDDKTWMGSLAEAKVAASLTLNKFDVFNQQSGKAPFDLVAHKDGSIYRVSVKCCNTIKNNAFNVQLKSVRHNKNENRILTFDSSKCDVVAIYLLSIDTVCYVKADELNGKSDIRLRVKANKFTKQKQWIISDYTKIWVE